MPSITMLRNAINNPVIFLRYLNRLYFSRLNTRNMNTGGVDVFNEDWDNLIILDACRYDMLKNRNDLPGKMEYRYSRGSTTSEFLQANLEGKTLEDTVYVTANPQYYHHRTRISGRFHTSINIWKDEGWDETFKTVLPETTTEYAVKAAKEYPQKRLVIHYIQPHYPFTDPKVSFDKQQLHTTEDKRAFWNEIFLGNLDVSQETVWDLYTRNLDRALQSVKTMLDDIVGKTIITADHGNMVGERSFPIPIREWGHPRGIYTEPLVKVPWVVIDDDQRKTIISEAPEETASSVEDDVVRHRLEDLGYV